jgi:hypothetical protein
MRVEKNNIERLVTLLLLLSLFSLARCIKWREGLGAKTEKNSKKRESLEY